MPDYDELTERIRVLELELNSRRASESSLLCEVERLQSILDVSRDWIVQVDRKLRVLWANRVTNDYAMRPQTDLTEYTCHQIFVGSDEICANCPCLRAMETRQTVHEVFFLPYFAGQHDVYLDYYGVPTIDEDGKVNGAVQIVRNITVRVKAEKDLKELNEYLEQRINERTLELQKAHHQLLHAAKLGAVGRLSASIAHEFNNPLFGIQNVIGCIKNSVKMEKEVRDLVELALRECDRMKRLILDLQSFYRPTTGRKAPLDIHQAIEDMLLLCKKDLKLKKIQVIREFQAENPVVGAVEDQIKQVLLNLLSNAADAIPESGGTITLRTSRTWEYLILDIEDTGEGIAAGDMDKIFEPFFTTKSAVKGTGLGLPVSYGIIKSHGGEIEVDSMPGKGTVFHITFPL